MTSAMHGSHGQGMRRMQFKGMFPEHFAMYSKLETRIGRGFTLSAYNDLITEQKADLHRKNFNCWIGSENGSCVSML